MANAFVDYTNGLDANNGLSTAAPKKTLQAGVGVLSSAGDVLKCTLGGAAYEPLSTYVTVAKSGTIGAEVQIVGVNPAWEEDGTQYIVDGRGYSQTIMYVSGSAHIMFRNIKVQNHGGGAYDGWNLESNTSFTFCNCSSENATRDAFSSAPGNARFIACKAINPARYGFTLADRSSADYCYVYSSGNHSIYVNGYSTSIVGCLIVDSAASGIYGNSSYAFHVKNSTIVGCVNGISAATGTGTGEPAIVIGNVITHNSGYGIVMLANKPGFENLNVFYSNTSGNISGNMTLGGRSVSADPQYINRAGGNYNRAIGAPLTNTQLAFDALNSYYLTSGIVPAAPAPASGGGGFIQCGSGRFGVMEG